MASEEVKQKKSVTVDEALKKKEKKEKKEKTERKEKKEKTEEQHDAVGEDSVGDVSMADVSTTETDVEVDPSTLSAIACKYAKEYSRNFGVLHVLIRYRPTCS